MRATFENKSWKSRNENRIAKWDTCLWVKYLDSMPFKDNLYLAMYTVQFFPPFYLFVLGCAVYTTTKFPAFSRPFHEKTKYLLTLIIPFLIKFYVIKYLIKFYWYCICVSSISVCTKSQVCLSCVLCKHRGSTWVSHV